MEDKLITYGGQAVIEGVMMRGRTSLAIAMRDPLEILLHIQKILVASIKASWLRFPF